MISPTIKQCVILAGGFGSRLSEETQLKPKPMVEVNGKPILLRIMRHYSKFGVSEFIILAGYKADYIKKYFRDYYLEQNDIEVDLSSGKVNYLKKSDTPWKVTIVDTGFNTMTGGRLKRVQDMLDPIFHFTYGDGVGNVDIDSLVKSHLTSQKIGTITAVQPSGRFGALDIDESNTVTEFNEKPKGDGAWVNAGFMLLKSEVCDYIDDDTTVFENESLPLLVNKCELNAYFHRGFWQPMDTLRDKHALDEYFRIVES
jgi:glucose-1-phosphate cytidylyltransferase